MRSAEINNHNFTYILYGIMPLCNFQYRKSYLLCNFITIDDIFTQLRPNIEHHQLICREQEPSPPTFFYRIMPLCYCKYANCIHSITVWV